VKALGLEASQTLLGRRGDRMKMLFAALHVQRVRYAAAFGVLSGLSVAIVGKRAGQFRPSVYRACPHVPKMSLHFSLSSRT
jgi:hypothetical protein